MVQNIEKDGMFPNSFYKASITLTPKGTKSRFEKVLNEIPLRQSIIY